VTTEMLPIQKDVQLIARQFSMDGIAQEELQDKQILAIRFVETAGSLRLSNVMIITRFQTMAAPIASEIMGILALQPEEGTNHVTLFVETV